MDLLILFDGTECIGEHTTAKEARVQPVVYQLVERVSMWSPGSLKSSSKQEPIPLPPPTPAQSAYQ